MLSAAKAWQNAYSGISVISVLSGMTESRIMFLVGNIDARAH